jgi:hypothetical protein
MGRSCSGTVNVMLPAYMEGLDWHKGAVWDQEEYISLSSAVTKLIRINRENNNKEALKG